MLISLDYDNTYTRDPQLWDQFIDLATQAGHTVICVTMRQNGGKLCFNRVIELVCTAGKAKVEYCKSRDILVDIWIDDQPHRLVTDVLAM